MGNINSLELQFRDNYQCRGTEFTQVLQECSSSRELTQCNWSMTVVDSDRCGMTAISRPRRLPNLTPTPTHATYGLPIPGIIISLRLLHNAHWFVPATPAK